MRDRDIRLNGSGCPDPTAEKAIRTASETVRNGLPNDLDELIKAIKTIAKLSGYQIENRIIFRDLKHNKVYK